MRQWRDDLEETEALRETIRKKRDDKEPRIQRDGQ
jgi:hypothetical protein